MTKSFEGKVAMITGAASGIGEAAAILFAKNGTRTVVADRDPDKGEAVAAAIRQMGGDAFFHQVDVADSEQVRGLIAATVEPYGRSEVQPSDTQSLQRISYHFFHLNKKTT